jgi:sigma-E factor negative regulatory protein RseB
VSVAASVLSGGHGYPWRRHSARLARVARPARSVGRNCARGGLAALLILALPVGVLAGEAAGGRVEERSDAAWLQAIQDAAHHQSFSGTIVYQRGDEVHASRVVQSYNGVEARERVLTLDGQQREFIRQGEEVQCLYPQLRQVVVEHGGARSFPAFAEPLAADVLAHYELRREGTERVAGSMCDVVSLAPRDKMRYGYRLWVEPTSGLLFKAQTLNERGAVLEQVAFTDVHVGEPIDPAQLKPSWSTAGWTVVRQQSQATELRQQGWSVTPPSGFHRLAEVVRHLVGAGDPSPRSALQAVYSDGLATVSVFIEPGAPMVDEPEEAQRRGPVTALSRQVGNARVTVVGEVPPSTAQSIADSVVRSPPPR